MAYKNKVSKELMPVAWEPTKRWDWCVSENEKIKTIFIA